jgi:hypothetical protein
MDYGDGDAKTAPINQSSQDMDIYLDPLIELKTEEVIPRHGERPPPPPCLKDVLSKRRVVDNFHIAGFCSATMHKSYEDHYNSLAADIAEILTKGSKTFDDGTVINASEIWVNDNAKASIEGFPGLIVVYRSSCFINNPWRFDGYKWRGNTPRKIQNLKSNQWLHQSSNDKDKQNAANSIMKKKLFFTPDDSFAILLYLRMQEGVLTVPPPHGNAKHNLIPFYPTAPVLLKKPLFLQFRLLDRL